MKNLELRTWLGFAALGIVMAAMLFGCAGSFRYWHAWIYLLLFFGLSAVITIDLMRRDPALLERRLSAGPTAEQRPLQRLIMSGATVGFILLHVLPALSFRFGMTTVPLAGVLLGDALFLIGFGFVGRVYRENTYTSATIEVAENQRVISTGPYAVVRHPMYASALLYLLGTPLALGSYSGFIGFAVMMPFLIWRLIDEEHMLARELPGYTEYQSHVRYRLIPFVW